MDEWIVGVVRQMGPIGVGFLMLLENVFPPIPSELIMPLAGYLSTTGQMLFWSAVLAGTVGAMLGATGWYAVARRVGREGLMRFADGRGRWLGIDRPGLERAQHWFDQHSRRAVFIGRLIPGVRTFISIPAGFTGMPLGQFLLYTLIGTALWTAALGWAGKLLAQRFGVIEQYIGIVSWVVIGGAVLLYVRRVVRIRRGGRQRASQRGQR